MQQRKFSQFASAASPSHAHTGQSTTLPPTLPPSAPPHGQGRGCVRGKEQSESNEQNANANANVGSGAGAVDTDVRADAQWRLSFAALVSASLLLLLGLYALGSRPFAADHPYFSSRRRHLHAQLGRSWYARQKETLEVYSTLLVLSHARETGVYEPSAALPALKRLLDLVHSGAMTHPFAASFYFAIGFFSLLLFSVFLFCFVVVCFASFCASASSCLCSLFLSSPSSLLPLSHTSIPSCFLLSLTLCLFLPHFFLSFFLPCTSCSEHCRKYFASHGGILELVHIASATHNIPILLTQISPDSPLTGRPTYHHTRKSTPDPQEMSVPAAAAIGRYVAQILNVLGTHGKQT